MEGTVVVDTAKSLIDFSTLDTSMVLPTVVAAITAGIGICISGRVIRKGYNVLLGFIGRA